MAADVIRDSPLGQLLKARGMTQAAYAEKVGVHPSIVGLWCTGRRRIPEERLAVLAEALHCSVKALSPLPKCIECGDPMNHVRTRTRCQSCVNRQHWREGRFALAAERRSDRWTAEEESLLRIMATKYSAAEIAERLGCRTRHAVNRRAFILGLNIQTEDWSQARICQLFGVSAETCTKLWFATGLMRATRVTGGTQYGEWRVTEATLEAFILDCPWAYDAKLMMPQTHRLAQIAQRVQRRDPWLNVAEAAIELQLSASAVLKWCRIGIIPFRRRQACRKHFGVGGLIVIRVADLAAAKERILNRYRQAKISRCAKLLEAVQSRRAA